MWGEGDERGSGSSRCRSTESNRAVNMMNRAVSCVLPACVRQVAGRAGRVPPPGPADKQGGPGVNNWARAVPSTATYWSARPHANPVTSGEAVVTGERAGRWTTKSTRHLQEHAMAGMAGARLAPAAWVGMMAMAAFRSSAYCAVKVPAAVAVPSMTKTGVNGLGMGKGDVRART